MLLQVPPAASNSLMSSGCCKTGVQLRQIPVVVDSRGKAGSGQTRARCAGIDQSCMFMYIYMWWVGSLLMCFVE